MMREIEELNQRRLPRVEGKIQEEEFVLRASSADSSATPAAATTTASTAAAAAAEGAEAAGTGAAIGSLRITYYGPFFLTESDFQFLDTLNGALLLCGAIALGLAVAVALALARRITAPVTAAAQLAQHIADDATGNPTKSWGQAASDDAPIVPPPAMSWGHHASDNAPNVAPQALAPSGIQTRELDELLHSVRQLSDGLKQREALRRRAAGDVAHELRTPLATVSAQLEGMVDGVWEPTPERLAALAEEVLRLSALVGDLERLAAAESEALVLRRAELDLLALTRQAVAAFEPLAADAGIELQVQGSKTQVSADADRLRQVLTNLLSNAIAHTPAGGQVSVTVEPAAGAATTSDDAAGAAGATGATITVSDTGEGIPPDALPFVFERFFRADPSRSRATGGAGIGLAIAKALVEAHGGSIEAESRTTSTPASADGDITTGTTITIHL
jgi:signal transduction histidine kinase